MTETVREAMANNHPIILFQGKEGNIELQHDGKFIKAIKDIDNRKQYHFDMQQGKFMTYYPSNERTNYVKTSSITKWFTHANIYTYNYKFAKLVLFNKKRSTFELYTNPARFIEGLQDNTCTRCEKWDSLGVKIIEMENILDDYNVGEQLHRGWRRQSSNYYINKAPNDIDKNLLKVIKEYEQPLSIQQLNNFLSDSYSIEKHQILQKLLEYEKQEEYCDLLKIPNSYWRRGVKIKEYNSILTHDKNTYEKARLLDILDTYNINIDKFMQYLKQLQFEYTDIQWIVYNYKDYLDAEYFLRDNKMRKMNKYPSNLVQMHHNRTEVMKTIEEEKRKLKEKEYRERDKKIYKSYKHLEYAPKKSEYCIVVPDSADDVIEEGNSLNHCVGGYIDNISQEKTFIVFMRKQEEKDKSFITVEIKNNKLRTALGMLNRKLEDDERRFLERFAKDKDLEYTAYAKLEE